VIEIDFARGVLPLACWQKREKDRAGFFGIVDRPCPYGRRATRARVLGNPYVHEDAHPRFARAWRRRMRVGSWTVWRDAVASALSGIAVRR
jgi:hypothetical protein